MSDIERIAHIRVDECGFNLYITFAYSSMTLHVWKYDEENIEYEWFDNVPAFNEWIRQPIQRITI